MKKTLYIFLLMFVLSFTQTSFAQTQPEPLTYKQINKNLEKIESDLKSGKITIDDTVDYIKQLNRTQNDVSDTKRQDEQDLSVIQRRIEALGDAPKEGEKEARDISLKRVEFSSQVSALRAKIAEADLIITKIDELDNLILQTRNKDLLGNILNRQDLIANPQELWETSIQFGSFLYEIIKSPVTWYDGLRKKEKTEVSENIVLISGIMIVALMIGIYLSYFIRKRFGYRRSVENPDYSQKVFAAIWTSIALGVIPAAMIGGFLLWLNNTPVVNVGFFGLILHKTALYLLYIFLARAVVKVVFATNNSVWRLIEVCDEKAVSLGRALLFSIILIGIVSLIETIAADSHATSEVIYFIKLLSNAVKMSCIVLVSYNALYDTKALTDDEMIQDEEDVEEDIGELSVSSKASLLISFSAIAVFILSFFGYISLSEYIFDRFMYSILVIGVFYILNKVVRALFHRILLLRFWTRNLRISRRTLVKTDFWFGFFFTPVILSVLILSLLGLWGVSVDILIQNIKKFLMGFNVGGIRVSIVSILLGVIVFFVTWIIFKTLKKSILTGAFTKIDMDEGVRNSLASGFGFLGFVVSIIFAIAVMGGNLSSLTIIAGALSFGAGLGLQNVVSNFVSGIIILFERPIKIGDWVNINGQDGIVKQINIRATEIEAWDKSNIIIPNATILSSSLTNLTHYNKMGKATANVGVGYDSDLKKVKEILLDIAKNTKKVLATPAPYAALKNLGDNAIEFELGCYTNDVMSRSGISNELREQIVDRFREAGIDIPYPQQVVHEADK